MNERIGQLAKKAGINLTPDQFSGVREDEVDEFTLEDFAELLVKECISTLEEKIYQSIDNDGDEVWADLILKQHFGVE